LARLLNDAENRNSKSGFERPTWINQKETIEWRNQSADALEALDSEINVIQLRFKSRLGEPL